MKPNGHKQVAEEAGIPRLKIALKAYDIPPDSYPSGLEAFYLGNWLADHRQFKDPHGVIEKVFGSQPDILITLGQTIRVNLENSILELVMAALEKLPEEYKKENEVRATELKTKISGEINRLFSAYQTDVVAPLRKFLSTKDVDDFLRSFNRYRAYSKFVHPPGENQLAMDYSVFSKIFDRHYTQYFPHEHFDRPEASRVPEGYATSAAKQNKQFADISNSDTSSDSFNLYKYSEDYIRIIVGDLNRLDVEWASKYLSKKTPIEQSDIDWHFGLSDLGSDIHLIEDFFAHSNFVEILILNKSSAEIREICYDQILLAKAFSGKEIKWEEQIKIDRAIENIKHIKKRLRLYVENVDIEYDNLKGIGIPEDENVVTGFFDGTDSFVAVLESILDHFKSEKDDSDGTLQNNLKEIFEELFDKEFALLSSIKGAFSDYQLVEQTKLLQEYLTTKENNNNLKGINKLHSEIQKDVLLIVRFIFKGLRILSKCLLIFYYLIRNLINWLPETKMLKSFSAKMEKFGMEKAKELIFEILPKYLLKKGLKAEGKLIYDLIDPGKLILNKLGKNRIGSHSLLAKDLPQEPLYKEMFNCAKTVHWFVVDALCRWADEKWKNNKNTPEWIDWEDLLFYFLRHPAKTTTVKQTIKQDLFATYDYTTQPDNPDDKTYLSMYKKYVNSQLFSYDYFLLLNNVPVSYLTGTSGGTEIDLLKLTNLLIITRKASADPERKNEYILKSGLTINVPFLSQEKVDLPNEAVWYDKILSLNTKEWKDFFAAFMEDRKSYNNTENTLILNKLYDYKFLDKETNNKKTEKYVKLKQEFEKAYNRK